MKKLFILVSEVSVFTARHPEYTHFEEVKDKTGELVGYNASIPKRTKRTKRLSKVSHIL